MALSSRAFQVSPVARDGAARTRQLASPLEPKKLVKFEIALGIKLFKCDRRRVLVTPAGALVLDQLRSILRSVQELLDVATRASDPYAGAQRVGVIPTISPYLLPIVAPSIRQAFPRLSVFWTEERTEALLARLHAGTLDTLLVALEAELGDLEHDVIARDPFMYVSKAAAGKRTRKALAAIKTSELAGADVFLLDDGDCFRDYVLAICAKAKAHELGFRATSLSTLAQMVAGGAGVTLLPRLAVATEATRAGLDVRAFVEPAPTRTIALVWRKRSPNVELLRELGRVLRKAYLKYV